MSTEPTEAEVQRGAETLPTDWLVRTPYARAVLAAVLPLYRDRLLTELADEAAVRERESFICDSGARWLRSKVGESTNKKGDV